VEGITLELWLDHAVVQLGAPVLVLVRVSNRGTQTVIREGNECGQGPAPVTIVPSSELPSPGPWTGTAAAFRMLVMEDGARSHLFSDARHLFEPGSGGCLLYSLATPLAPGDAAEMLVGWRAIGPDGERLGPGPARITSVFTYWAEGSNGPSGDGETMVVASSMVELVGDLIGTYGLADYADAALGDAAFVAWLETQPPERWLGTNVTHWPGAFGTRPSAARYAEAVNGAVDVILALRDERHALVTLDALTLEVLGRELPS
jgi:hypothetical protein